MKLLKVVFHILELYFFHFLSFSGDWDTPHVHRFDITQVICFLCAGVSYGEELQYVFGFPFINNTYINMTGIYPRQYYDFNDRNISEYMMTMFTNFTARGWVRQCSIPSNNNHLKYRKKCGLFLYLEWSLFRGTFDTVLPPNNNHPKCTHSAAFFFLDLFIYLFSL